MGFWNIINDCRSVTKSCSNRISSASASNTNSEINIHIKRNKINNEIRSLNTLLLCPISTNADIAKSIASNAKSLTNDISHSTNSSSKSYSKATNNTYSSSSNISNNHVKAIIRKHNQSIISSATSMKSKINSETSFNDDTYNKAKNMLTTTLDNLATSESDNANSADDIKTNVNEINEFNMNNIISSNQDITNASDTDTTGSYPNFNTGNDTNNVNNILDFSKIDNKNNINKRNYARHETGLHGFEHHMQHVQNASAIHKYTKNFIPAIITVFVTIFLIGIVSYASSLF